MQPERVFKITDLAKQKKKPWRTSVFIDGKFWHGFETSAVVELGLHEGQLLSANELEKLECSLEKQHAINRAVLLLSYRPRSIHEVTERLAKAGFEPKTIASAIDDLKRLGYLDDDAFAGSWAKNRIESKFYGTRRIKQELRLKGIPEEIITGKLEEITSPEEEYGHARALAKGKLSSLKELDRDVAYRRLSQFLLRRGYSASTVYDVCRDILGHRE
jgi:regulatory protein